ncbi:hypothetical protein BV20DRAFT_29829 [Pilatotrama ljubarskyi]|nr:hypothetical protein BV20DRAFT_29829 [Pilatotrama ljubarskyi]
MPRNIPPSQSVWDVAMAPSLYSPQVHPSSDLVLRAVQSARYGQLLAEVEDCGPTAIVRSHGSVRHPFCSPSESVEGVRILLSCSDLEYLSVLRMMVRVSVGDPSRSRPCSSASTMHAPKVPIRVSCTRFSRRHSLCVHAWTCPPERCVVLDAAKAPGSCSELACLIALHMVVRPSIGESWCSGPCTFTSPHFEEEHALPVRRSCTRCSRRHSLCVRAHTPAAGMCRLSYLRTCMWAYDPHLLVTGKTEDRVTSCYVPPQWAEPVSSSAMRDSGGMPRRRQGSSLASCSPLSIP